MRFIVFCDIFTTSSLFAWQWHICHTKSSNANATHSH